MKKALIVIKPQIYSFISSHTIVNTLPIAKNY